MYGVKNNAHVHYTVTKPAAQSTTPANVARTPQAAPPPGPTPTSGHSSTSGFGGRSPPTSHDSTRTPSPQEHATLNARTGSLGYGGRTSRSPSPPPPPSPTVPPWGVRPDIQTFAQAAVTGNPGTQLTHMVAQGSHPGTNGGVCHAMTTAWIAHGAQSSSMEQASSAFAQTIHQGMNGLIGKQAQVEAQLNPLKAELKQNNAEHAQALKDLQDLTPFLNKRDEGKLSPKRAAQVNTWEAELDTRLGTINGKIQQTKAKLVQTEMDVAAQIGGGLPHTRTADMQPISRSFVRDLDRATQQPGFYALHLPPKGPGEGHVVGIQVGKDGSCKFMDPNTGEFVTKDRKGMLNVAADHISSMYMNRADHFSVDRFG